MKRKYIWTKDPRKRRKKPTVTKDQKRTRLLTKIQAILKNDCVVETYPWLREKLIQKEKEISEKKESA